mgnify:CR=1 FL=1
MSEYDPGRVGRYGNLVEKWAARNYPIELDYPMMRGLKFDGTTTDGLICDVKGSMANGVRPTFKFWKDQHDALASADGVTILDSRSVDARSLRIDNWTNPGDTHHRSHSREAQIPADQLRP